MPVASSPAVVTSLHWAVTVTASLLALLGGWSLGRHLPRVTFLAVLGELAGVGAFLYLGFFAGISVYSGLAPLVLGALGLMAGLMARRKATRT
ncbi:hypothetical protein [Deinococcus wulumuqiensis]|uniref:hypothetical protein n=1 Tax=Deinococcus wulumuqiensis TaxID=980427 RepID=UPI002431B058|nr:hypothetical protein [Deinococcus wulumuqiensis]